MSGFVALRRGATADALRRLRAATRGGEGAGAARARAALAYGVALASAGPDGERAAGGARGAGPRARGGRPARRARVRAVPGEALGGDGATPRRPACGRGSASKAEVAPVGVSARRAAALGVRLDRLHQLDEDAARRLRVDERDLVAVRAGARRLVDERDAERRQEGERLLDALHLHRDVVQARAALLQEPLDGRRCPWAR